MILYSKQSFRIKHICTYVHSVCVCVCVHVSKNLGDVLLLLGVRSFKEMLGRILESYLGQESEQ